LICASPADTAIVNIHPMAALNKSLRGYEMTDIVLLKAAVSVAFTRRRQERHHSQLMRHADLCPISTR